MKNKIVQILKKFPKKRLELPESYRNIYEDYYKINRDYKYNLLNRIKFFIENIMHYQASKIKESNILELGAGNLNHLYFERGFFTYDIVEPNRFLYKNSLMFNKIDKICSDILEIPIDSKYDIISIAVLEHLTDLPLVLDYIGLLMSNKPNYLFFAGIPSEGKLLWVIAWRLTTGVHFKIKYGRDYSVLMKHEHVNTCDEIVVLCDYFFQKVNFKKFPFGISHLSLYYLIYCSNPHIQRIAQYLEEREIFYEKRYYNNY